MEQLQLQLMPSPTNCLGAFRNDIGGKATGELLSCAESATCLALVLGILQGFLFHARYLQSIAQSQTYSILYSAAIIFPWMLKKYYVILNSIHEPWSSGSIAFKNSARVFKMYIQCIYLNMQSFVYLLILTNAVSALHTKLLSLGKRTGDLASPMNHGTFIIMSLL